MQPVAVQLGDRSQRGEVPLQYGSTAETQAARGVGNAQGLERAGISQAMALLGAGRFVRLADDCQAVDQPPVVRRGEREGKESSSPLPGCHSTNPPGIERQADPEPRRARRESSRSLSARPAALAAANASEANAEAEEAIPVPIGKLFSLVTCAPSPMPLRLRTRSRNSLTRESAWPSAGEPVEDQRVGGEFGTEPDACARVQPFQVDRDRAVGGEVQVGVAVAPVFDQGDVRVGERCGEFYQISIPLVIIYQYAHDFPA